MKLFRNYLKKCIKISQKNNMRVKVIGDITAFDSDIQESIEKLEDFFQRFHRSAFSDRTELWKQR